MEKQKTQKQMYEMIASLLSDNVEVQEFCTKKIEQLDKKSGSISSAKAAEMTAIQNAILDSLASIGQPATVTDIMKSNEYMAQYSNQKITSMLNKLVEEKRVINTREKKKSFYSLAN